MRIVGGKFRGKQLKTPQSQDIRPTSDRVRESVFNMLTNGPDGDLINHSRVLDLFAGTGANGLEALSRGATFTLFVDNGAEARGLLRENTMALGQQGASKIWRRDATDMGRCAPMAPFDIVFLDPPYEQGLGEKALMSLVDGGWLAPNATLVFEEALKAEISLPTGFEMMKEKPYGQTKILFLKQK